MADDIPPLSPQPDSSSISSDQLDAMQHASRWAGTFGGQDTNIAERARHNQDISDYANALTQQRAQAQQQLIQTNQTAQNLWLGTQRLQLQEQQAEMHMAVQQAQLAATGATERRKAAEALAQANDTAGLNQSVADMLTNGVKPQTPEWNLGLANAMAKYSTADPAHISKLGSSMFPGQRMSPDEYIQAAKDLKTKAAVAGLQNTQIHEFQGRPTIVEGAAPKATDHIAQFQDQLASTTPVYGSGDGASFTPVAAGQGAQTHVQATYVTPQGKAVTQVFPRPFFDSMVAASKARSSAPAASPPDQPPPDITPEAHAALKSGDKFWWKGQQLIKQ